MRLFLCRALGSHTRNMVSCSRNSRRQTKARWKCGVPGTVCRGTEVSYRAQPLGLQEEEHWTGSPASSFANSKVRPKLPGRTIIFVHFPSPLFLLFLVLKPVSRHLSSLNVSDVPYHRLARTRVRTDLALSSLHSLFHPVLMTTW